MAIIARALRIPTVLGVHDVTRRIASAAEALEACEEVAAHKRDPLRRAIQAEPEETVNNVGNGPLSGLDPTPCTWDHDEE